MLLVFVFILSTGNKITRNKSELDNYLLTTTKMDGTTLLLSVLYAIVIHTCVKVGTLSVEQDSLQIFINMSSK